MNPAAIATLVLGSSVLGAVLGAYIKSSTERETEFRERMVKASVDFLSVVKGAQDALRHALRSVNAAITAAQTEHEVPKKIKDDADGALAALDSSMSDLRGMIPLLLIVFPTAEVSDAAQALTDALDEARTRLAAGWHRGRRIEFASDEPTRLDVLHLQYAEAVRRDIRRGAYRSRFWTRRPRSGRHPKSSRRPRPSPIPPLRYRLLGPSVLKSDRWRSTGR